MPSSIKREIDAFRYEGDGTSRAILWDTEVCGLGVRAFPNSHTKTFVLSYRRSGRKRLMKLDRYGAITLDQARNEARDALVLVRKGQDPLEEKRHGAVEKTFGALRAKYFEYARAKGNKSTQGDEQRFDRHVPKSWASREVAAITASDIADLLRPIGERTPYAHNRLLALLRTMFRRAQRADWMFLDSRAPLPTTDIEMLREESRDRYLRADELPHLANAIDTEGSIYLRALFWTYLLTGLRKNELLNAKRVNVDWAEGRLRLPDTKSGKAQWATLSGPALAILQSLPAMERNPYLFPSSIKKGRPINNVSKAWARIKDLATVTWWAGYSADPAVPALVERLRKEAGWEPTCAECRSASKAEGIELPDGLLDLQMRDLRRTVGSMMSAAGVDLNLIKTGLRHSNVATTLIYARLGQDASREAFEQHGRRILEAAGKAGPVGVPPASG